MWTFLLASIVIIVVPGADMALVTRQVLRHGRRAAFATLFGLLTAGLTHAALAAAGLSALLMASAIAYAVLRIVGAAYLVGLGIQTLRAARRRRGTTGAWAPHARAQPCPPRPLRRDYLLGVMSNLTNPKMAVFFLTFLPQFIVPGPQAAWRAALLGVLFNLIASSWWIAYVLVLQRIAATLHRPSVRRAIERITGVVLIGLGMRLAAEQPSP